MLQGQERRPPPSCTKQRRPETLVKADTSGPFTGCSPFCDAGSDLAAVGSGELPVLLCTGAGCPLPGSALTQVLAHAFEVVQIIGHRVGEVHEDVEVHGALQGLEDIHVEAHLLTSSQPQEHALGGHLGLLQGRVDTEIL